MDDHIPLPLDQDREQIDGAMRIVDALHAARMANRLSEQVSTNKTQRLAWLLAQGFNLETALEIVIICGFSTAERAIIRQITGGATDGRAT